MFVSSTETNPSSSATMQYCRPLLTCRHQLSALGRESALLTTHRPTWLNCTTYGMTGSPSSPIPSNENASSASHRYVPHRSTTRRSLSDANRAATATGLTAERCGRVPAGAQSLPLQQAGQHSIGQQLNPTGTVSERGPPNAQPAQSPRKARQNVKPLPSPTSRTAPTGVRPITAVSAAGDGRESTSRAAAAQSRTARAVGFPE